MHARSAASGDRSLQAAVAATKKVAEEMADDHLVFLLSDANLGRYVDIGVFDCGICWLWCTPCGVLLNADVIIK